MGLSQTLGDSQMNNRLQSAMKVGVLAASMVLAVGCAGMQEQIDANKAAAATASQDASSAKAAAEAAQRAAEEAKRAVSGAQSTASQALSAANEAQRCCDATNEKLDRMFKKSQQK